MADCYDLDAAHHQRGPVATEQIARLIRGGTSSRETMIWSAAWRTTPNRFGSDDSVVVVAEY